MAQAAEPPITLVPSTQTAETIVPPHAAQSPKIQTGDLVLLASTRNYPSVPARVLNFNQFVGYTCGTNGVPANVPTSLVEPGSFNSTWVFVHGNQIPPREAVKRGMAVYQRLRSCVPSDEAIRFVIWSWPSERNTNRIADAYVKKRRTDVESFFLGSYLAAIAEDCRVKIISYSFGARIVCGGLHLASGGQLDGRCLPRTTEPLAPYRVAFMVAAVEKDGFTSRGRYSHALNHVDQLLLMNNSRDQALRFFWILDSSKPTALGRSGLNCRPPHVLVNQYDWGDIVGKDHSLWGYLDRSFVISKIANTLQ